MDDTQHILCKFFLFLQCYQSSHHAPLVHLSEIKNKVLPYSVTKTNILPKNEDNSSSTLLELDREDYEQGKLTITSITVVQHISSFTRNDTLYVSPVVTHGTLFSFSSVGIFTVKEYYKFTTLFPNALLPLINLIIRALSLSHVSMETTDAETTPTTTMPCTPARGKD